MCCLGCFQQGLAQSLSNKRERTVAMADTVVTDRFPILPSSVMVSPSIDFQVLGNTIRWQQVEGLADSLQITYRILQVDLQSPTKHLDTALIKREYKGDYIGVDFGQQTIQDRASLFDNKGLQYSGSFARGISFGNSQNLVLNSSFNLQIAGKLGDDTEIIAALTDENIPLQADGNTQQLNEFDKIYVQINRPNTMLKMGDYELASPAGYFSKYFKKLQGVTFEFGTPPNADSFLSLGKSPTLLKRGGNGNRESSGVRQRNIETEQTSRSTQNIKSEVSPLSKRGSGGVESLHTQASAAIARGKFARNFITPQEGNQGPYRLQGNEGEPFIIILSGTEKVWIDGQVMERGIEADYVIDYNRGELTFMNRQLITKDRRIIVELEYIDQTFQRSLLAWNTNYQTERMRLYANFFSQQDSKRAVGNVELTEAQTLQLQEVGDGLDNAFSSSIRSLEEEFNPARIQYLLRDTVYQIRDSQRTDLQTIPVSILVFANTAEGDLVTARFTEVGWGNGNYIQANPTGANGRVFEWVAPTEGGIPQGNFAPIQQLTAPEKQQLLTLGTEYLLSDFSSLQVEGAFSNTDLNRLSDNGNEDNIGTALFTNYQLQRPLGTNGWEVTSQLKYEFVQQDFRALNPYRDPEFNRDWNIGLNKLEAANEHIGKGTIRLQQADQLVLDYGFSGFFRDAFYTGTKHDFLSQYQQNGYDLKMYGSLLNTETQQEQTQFFRPRIDFSKTFEQLNNWKIGVYGEREKNDRRGIASDSLQATSFYWDLYKVYLEKPQTGKFHWHIHYLKRYDYAPKGSAFLNNTTADEINLNGQWQYQRGGQLRWNFSYRNLVINQADLSDQQARSTYLGRLDYNLQAWRGALRLHTNYEIGSGQEAKTEFQFIRVNTGEGLFVWNPTEEFDLNGDSIPQINEFVTAPFRDQANYIRINTFTNEFIRTNNVLFNQSIQLQPRAIWQQQKGWKKLLAQFSTLSTLRISRKVNDLGQESVWNPFDLAIADTSLINIVSNIRNVLYFNQHHPIYDVQVGQFDNRSRNLLTTGFESQIHAEQFIRGRFTFNSQFNSTIQFINGQRKRISELFANRAFDITFQKIIPKLTYVPNPQWELSGTYEYQKASNQLSESAATAIFHELQTSLQYNKTQKTSFRSELSFVQIDLNGEINPTLQLSLLEGLKSGKNFLWNITVDRQVATNVQLRIGYEGRKTGDRSIVHLGSMQIRAAF